MKRGRMTFYVRGTTDEIKEVISVARSVGIEPLVIEQDYLEFDQADSSRLRKALSRMDDIEIERA